MTDQVRSKATAKEAVTGSPATPASRPAPDGDAAERALGRAVAAGLPILSIACALIVGFVASVGSGLLVLASGALIGTIALLWASVRTLSGDAPLPADLEALAAQNRDVDALVEDKRRVLRALKDLENEHAIGKIDDADYETIAAQYRQEAKALMREMDHNAAPALAEAERIAREYLAKQGLGAQASAGSAVKSDVRGSRATVGADPGDDREKASERLRVVCPACAASNEPDAAFCKKCGTAVRAAGATTVKESDATS